MYFMGFGSTVGARAPFWCNSLHENARSVGTQDSSGSPMPPCAPPDRVRAHPARSTVSPWPESGASYQNRHHGLRCRAGTKPRPGGADCSDNSTGETLHLRARAITEPSSGNK